MGRRSRHTRTAGLLPLAALVACSPQVDSGYRGEPIATLAGVVASASALAPDQEVDAAIVWMAFGEGPNGPKPKYIGERIAVDGSFPATFSLKLFAPPAADAEVTIAVDYCIEEDGYSGISPDEPCDGQRIPRDTGAGIWVGALAAIDAASSDGEIDPEDIVGIDEDHMLFYSDHASDESLPSEPTAKDLVKAHDFIAPGYAQDYAYERGYHLLAVTPAWKARKQEARECDWQNMCVHWLGLGDYQGRFDRSFERCREHFPDNPTCSAFVESPAAGEPASSKECRERYRSSLSPDGCGFSFTEPMLVESPKGLSDPIRIQLGLGLWDTNW